VHSRFTLIMVALSLAACVSSSAPPPTELTPTSDPVTRLVRNEPGPVLRAGVATLREMGFEVAEPAPGAVRVFSEPLTLQSRWRGGVISDRVLCGIGNLAPSDANRITQLANTIPIALRLGYEVEPRADATATTILFVAEGRRTEGVVPGTPTMSCTLTVPFVNELFRELEATLRAQAAQ
jgi:hypothetical protein